MNLQYLDGDFGKSRTASRRETVFAKKGMVCTSQPLAAQAGLDALKAGGNAIDAAITAAAAMTVLEPTSNGLGSDAFAILWIEKEKKLIGLNASGKAPMGISLEEMKKKGYTSMPDSGWDPVMVPGAPAAWAKLTADYGRRTLAENVAPAARYAEEGFPVQPTVSALFAACAPVLKSTVEPRFFFISGPRCQGVYSPARLREIRRPPAPMTSTAPMT